MIRVKICLLVFWAVLSNARAMDYSSLFNQGNDWYLKGKYMEAIDLYDSLLAAGAESAELYYNLGNAWYKQGHYPKAILYYEKALLLNPGDEDVQFNLSFVNTHVVDKIEAIPEIFFARWWKSFISLLPVKIWGALALLFFILVFVNLWVFLLAKEAALKRLFFSVSMAFAFFVW
ncbi:MAG: tetratricopeptide repeat protein [Bacteroidales bacterium]|nr:tetratricopeptide repeat protein [Bacteroidales bacterium]